MGQLAYDDEAVERTYRGRAYHARMGAKESTQPEFRKIFETLAAAYENLANEAERLKRQAEDEIAITRRPERVKS